MTTQIHTCLAGATVLALTLSGCTFLPSSGPSGFRVANASGKMAKGVEYQLLKIDDKVLAAVDSHSKKASYLSANGRKSDELFGERGLQAFGSVSTNAIVMGDVVSVAIYETDSSLFGPSLAAGTIAVSPMTALPPQTVDQTGEKTQEFCKGGDEPNIDRVDYSAAGEESDGTSEEACIFEHDPAASDDAHHLEGFVLKKRMQD